jgi:bifunctional N-acetylglucosamine-1-phosphate-uridyltransferase/glucosamine-1-phosphate-acetyltransferase GlmU-like protein
MSYPNFENMTLLVPAAGLGTRMGLASSPKALILFQGRELISWATQAFVEFLSRMVIVVRKEHEPAFESYIKKNNQSTTKFAYQSKPSGTAYAVMTGLKQIDSEWVVLVWGDHVGASLAPAIELLTKTEGCDADFILPIVYRDKPYVYFINEGTRISLEFRETKHGAQVKDFGYSDCGFFIFKNKPVLNYLLTKLQHEGSEFPDEVNFLSLFAQMEKSGIVFEKVVLKDPRISIGINSPEELQILKQKVIFGH